MHGCLHHLETMDYLAQYFVLRQFQERRLISQRNLPQRATALLRQGDHFGSAGEKGLSTLYKEQRWCRPDTVHTWQRFDLGPDASLQRRLSPDAQQHLAAPRLAHRLADGLSILRQEFAHSLLSVPSEHHQHFVRVAGQLHWPACYLLEGYRSTTDGLRHGAQLPPASRGHPNLDGVGVIGVGQSLNDEGYPETVPGCQVESSGEPFIGDGPTHHSGGEAKAAALLAIHLRKGTIRIESKRD
jgi:hypothetical protein